MHLLQNSFRKRYCIPEAADSVNDFKEKVRSAVESSLMSLIDNIKDIQNDPDRMLNLDDAHNFLEMQQVSGECKVWKAFSLLSRKRNLGDSQNTRIKLNQEFSDHLTAIAKQSLINQLQF